MNAVTCGVCSGQGLARGPCPQCGMKPRTRDLSTTPRPYERTRQIMRVVAEAMVEGGTERGFALQDAARAAIETLEDELAEQKGALSDGDAKWIPVGEQLPNMQRMVLMHSPESQRGAVQYGFYGHRGGDSVPTWLVHTALGWEPAEFTGKPVTHWMPLPEAPK